ncbi:bifunctional adenosylcobinamide kinase/adenosylcobinamide-phosphate guanylyltransferase [Ornithinimicrobium sp. Arc0846-15]|uniref:bifunctional adenosylcobinamide kinase/adenosylcobinamide-phosphate guanylyltransferase n=1 Tax=Ornithinimicrobium sp. INDO-MA30-4 TaxID=2908651 RepID=UPI001C6842DB|nr:bifunctional adenosylcobinamide kinase/adenosylcobinamide-phosphate guanylyltransferase [Ornithinimicrobium sp. INDO-MA30-4]MBW8172928.1 bifunctional adenosylcobinamide kinase/adenosylcobinamide-phosphate guanylyltransferase [Ornithinimicrobium laminariae]UJH69952.1 bifunctional adenosylcobinamide kinase/adenosylcobinamide-phosphate guanylyltransferase [Ornithinimicrobium sp. INDO-MA30-4]
MIALILGGTRSGKSAVAESLITKWAVGAPVTYLATALVDARDADHAARVQTHQDRRGSGWITRELAEDEDLTQVLAATSGPVLLDSLGTWLTRHFDEATESFSVDVEPVLAALARRDGDTVIVSEEVGLAVHPPTRLGRRYVDAIGHLNQQVSAVADHRALVVAGQVLSLGRADAWSDGLQ